jgi:peptidoglycan/xylan/chitin deacetylase (PgdA/CDA1 family)
MTVDVDPPYPSNLNPDIVRDGVAALLKLFDKHAVKATFFVPAVVAQRFPVAMEGIVRQGHEIACHGLEHNEREAALGIAEELRIIKTATEIIQSATGVRPSGFRAPLFKVNESCWIALQKNDYIYDSSIVCSRLYGDRKIFFPSKPFLLPICKARENCSLLEIPVSVNPFLPFPLGGAYLRIFGSRWSKVGVRINFLCRNPVVFHIHPKDVDPRTRGRAWWCYRNTGNCMKMVEGIIKCAEVSGAKFITAYELARLSMAEFVKNNFDYDNHPNP